MKKILAKSIEERDRSSVGTPSPSKSDSIAITPPQRDHIGYGLHDSSSEEDKPYVHIQGLTYFSPNRIPTSRSMGKSLQRERKHPLLDYTQDTQSPSHNNPGKDIAPADDIRDNTSQDTTESESHEEKKSTSILVGSFFFEHDPLPEEDPVDQVQQFTQKPLSLSRESSDPEGEADANRSSDEQQDEQGDWLTFAMDGDSSEGKFIL